MLAKKGRGPLEGIDVLTQTAVLPLQCGQLFAFAAGRAVPLVRVDLGLLTRSRAAVSVRSKSLAI
ncbi:hypothetical protein ACL02U_29385 [Streptomyces sp. MS06]|uniref:hypothetical protein n=1 Tax=Streptomyces sp. MS06 TaxID=3385974 RepID=UPI0039A15D89